MKRHYSYSDVSCGKQYSSGENSYYQEKSPKFCFTSTRQIANYLSNRRKAASVNQDCGQNGPNIPHWSNRNTCGCRCSKSVNVYGDRQESSNWKYRQCNRSFMRKCLVSGLKDMGINCLEEQNTKDDMFFLSRQCQKPMTTNGSVHPDFVRLGDLQEKAKHLIKPTYSYSCRFSQMQNQELEARYKAYKECIMMNKCENKWRHNQPRCSHTLYVDFHKYVEFSSEKVILESAPKHQKYVLDNAAAVSLINPLINLSCMENMENQIGKFSKKIQKFKQWKQHSTTSSVAHLFTIPDEIERKIRSKKTPKKNVAVGMKPVKHTPSQEGKTRPENLLSLEDETEHNVKPLNVDQNNENLQIKHTEINDSISIINPAKVLTNDVQIFNGIPETEELMVEHTSTDLQQINGNIILPTEVKFEKHQDVKKTKDLLSPNNKAAVLPTSKNRVAPLKTSDDKEENKVTNLQSPNQKDKKMKSLDKEMTSQESPTNRMVNLQSPNRSGKTLQSQDKDAASNDSPRHRAANMQSPNKAGENQQKEVTDMPSPNKKHPINPNRKVANAKGPDKRLQKEGPGAKSYTNTDSQIDMEDEIIDELVLPSVDNTVTDSKTVEDIYEKINNTAKSKKLYNGRFSKRPEAVVKTEDNLNDKVYSSNPAAIRASKQLASQSKPKVPAGKEPRKSAKDNVNEKAPRDAMKDKNEPRFKPLPEDSSEFTEFSIDKYLDPTRGAKPLESNQFIDPMMLDEASENLCNIIAGRLHSINEAVTLLLDESFGKEKKLPMSTIKEMDNKSKPMMHKDDTTQNKLPDDTGKPSKKDQILAANRDKPKESGRTLALRNNMYQEKGSKEVSDDNYKNDKTSQKPIKGTDLLKEKTPLESDGGIRQRSNFPKENRNKDGQSQKEVIRPLNKIFDKPKFASPFFGNAKDRQKYQRRNKKEVEESHFGFTEQKIIEKQLPSKQLRIDRKKYLFDEDWKPKSFSREDYHEAGSKNLSMLTSDRSLNKSTLNDPQFRSISSGKPSIPIESLRYQARSAGLEFPSLKYFPKTVFIKDIQCNIFTCLKGKERARNLYLDSRRNVSQFEKHCLLNEVLKSTKYISKDCRNISITPRSNRIRKTGNVSLKNFGIIDRQVHRGTCITHSRPRRIPDLLEVCMTNKPLDIKALYDRTCFLKPQEYCSKSLNLKLFPKF